MKRILLALVVLASSALAADVTGKWEGEGVTNGESHSLYLVLRQEGNTLTGSVGPDSSEQHDFKDAKVDGKKITIDVSVGNTGTLHFELEVDGDQMKGTVHFKDASKMESGPVTFKRAA
jgi:hypothetical protein